MCKLRGRAHVAQSMAWLIWTAAASSAFACVYVADISGSCSWEHGLACMDSNGLKCTCLCQVRAGVHNTWSMARTTQTTRVAANCRLLLCRR